MARRSGEAKVRPETSSGTKVMAANTRMIYTSLVAPSRSGSWRTPERRSGYR
jgi:hypothetical protein